MPGDPYDSYKAGITSASMIVATSALAEAERTAMSWLGYDHPLTVSIRTAHIEAVRARHMDSDAAQAAMQGRKP